MVNFMCELGEAIVHSFWSNTSINVAVNQYLDGD